MVRRLAIALIALVSLIAGGVVVYFALSIPNDVKAEALMRDARTQLNGQDRVKARESYEKVIRDYPRTDAAAQSIAAVLRMDADERARMQQKVSALEKSLAEQKARTTRLEERLAVAVKAAEKPPVVAKPPAKKPTIRRATPKKKTPTRRKKTPTRRRR